jgi:WD40 repeat protein
VIGTADEHVIVLGLCRRAFPMHSTGLAFRAGISAIAAAGRPLAVFATYFNGLVRFVGPGGSWIGRENMRHSLQGTAVALDQSCGFAASGNLNGEVQLWDCRSGACLVDLRLHEGAVTALAFVADGRFLLSAGGDSYVYVVDTATRAVAYGTVVGHPVVVIGEPTASAVDVLLTSGDSLRLELAAGNC